MKARTYATIAFGAGKSCVSSLNPSAMQIAMTPDQKLVISFELLDYVQNDRLRTHDDKSEETTTWSRDLDSRAAIAENASAYHRTDDDELWCGQSAPNTSRMSGDGRTR